MTRRLTHADMLHTLHLLSGAGVGMVIYVLLANLAGWLTMHHFHPTFLQQLWYLFVKVWLPAVLVSPIIVLCGLRFPIVPGQWTRAFFTHGALFFALASVHAILLSYHYHYFADMDAEMRTYKVWQHMGHFMFGDALILFDFIIYTLLIASINLRYFYFVAQAKDVEASELTHQLTRTRLQALRMQINPHFLFNTLNAISVLVMKQQNEKAMDMIGRLSHLFRQSLDETQLLTSLANELDTATQYLDIEKVRFEDRLAYEIRCEPDLLNAQVPPMLLQPLLENAVRHGLSKNEAGGTLSIQCSATENNLCIYIADNGAGFDTAKNVSGIGLDNVRERLISHYAGQAQFHIQSQFGRGTQVSIYLPLVMEAEAL